MIHNITQDILEIERGIVIQQVNCQGKFNAGLARATKEKYPQVAQTYLGTCSVCSPLKLLGTYLPVNLKLGEDNIQDLIYILIFGQLFYGRNERQTDYCALKNAFRNIVSDYCHYLDPSKNPKVYLPYQMGCGLAGGNWQVVREIIEMSFDENQSVYICRKPE